MANAPLPPPKKWNNNWKFNQAKFNEAQGAYTSAANAYAGQLIRKYAAEIGKAARTNVEAERNAALARAANLEKQVQKAVQGVSAAANAEGVPEPSVTPNAAAAAANAAGAVEKFANRLQKAVTQANLNELLNNTTISNENKSEVRQKKNALAAALIKEIGGNTFLTTNKTKVNTVKLSANGRYENRSNITKAIKNRNNALRSLPPPP